MKYPKELYEQTQFYEPDEEISNHTQKIVKCQTPHKCAMCGMEIKKGEMALNEKAIFDSKRGSCYTCIKCCDEILDFGNEDEYEEPSHCE